MLSDADYLLAQRVGLILSRRKKRTTTNQNKMKNSIKLIAAGAIAIAAFATTSAQADVFPGNKGSQSFVGTLKVTPGKYVEVIGITNAVSETINPVTITGTTITQGNSSATSVSSTTPLKVTNASVLKSIFASSNATVPKNTTLVWIVQGADAFAQGSLAALTTNKTKTATTYTVTPASSSVFDTDNLVAELVISKRTPAYKTVNKVKTLSSITTVSSAGIYDVSFEEMSVSGVGTITEVDDKPSDENSPISVTATLPLSGTLLE
jgi:hypothetical protein